MGPSPLYPLLRLSGRSGCGQPPPPQLLTRPAVLLPAAPLPLPPLPPPPRSLTPRPQTGVRLRDWVREAENFQINNLIVDGGFFMKMIFRPFSNFQKIPFFNMSSMFVHIWLSVITGADNSQGRRARTGSGRRPLYTAELWSRSLTPSQSEARLSQAELRLASTTAARGHSWRGEARPAFQIEKKFLFAVSSPQKTRSI